MKNKRLYVDIHVVQTVPPSCVNRDDTGSPKTAFYGGVNRARVSSQSWKKAVREEFKDIFPENILGMRTKKIVAMVACEIMSNLKEGEEIEAEDADIVASKLLGLAGLKVKSVEKGTDALFFMSYAQAKALAELYVEDPGIIEEPKKPTPEEKKIITENKKKAKEALSNNPGVDIALFGRMVADDPSLNTDACVQVAHAISTHTVSNEYDYFTAVDDLQEEDNAGAGHIGTVEFNSSTLYRYATVAVHALKEELGEDTRKAVEGFISAFCSSMPTGKQNTFANRTFPDAILVTLRGDQPVNLVGAFEKPIYTAEGGYVKPSCRALQEYAEQLYESFSAPLTSYVVGDDFSSMGEVLPLKELVSAVGEYIEKNED